MIPDRKLILKENIISNTYKYKKGDIFTVVGESFRGWDLRHNKSGNVIYDTLFISDKFSEYTIKEERKKKLKILNKNEIYW